VIAAPQDTLSFQAAGYGGIEVGNTVELDDASQSQDHARS
jgi:hypothetical protein